jgi:hypothetical protein
MQILKEQVKQVKVCGDKWGKVKEIKAEYHTM